MFNINLEKGNKYGNQLLAQMSKFPVVAVHSFEFVCATSNHLLLIGYCCCKTLLYASYAFGDREAIQKSWEGEQVNGFPIMAVHAFEFCNRDTP